MHDEADGVLVEAEALLALGQRDVAQQVLQDALATRPNHPRLLLALASTLTDGGQPARAVQSAERAVAAAPGSEEAHRVLALALLAARRPADAVRAALAAVQLAPASAEPLALLSRALTATGDVRGAVAAAGRAVQTDPASPSGWMMQGVIALRGHQFDVAEANFRKVLELRPGHEEAGQLLAAATRHRGVGVGSQWPWAGAYLRWTIVAAAVVLGVLFLLAALG